MSFLENHSDAQLSPTGPETSAVGSASLTAAAYRMLRASSSSYVYGSGWMSRCVLSHQIGSLSRLQTATPPCAALPYRAMVYRTQSACRLSLVCVYTSVGSFLM